MRRAVLRLTAAILLTGTALALAAGCSYRQTTNCPTPASAGINMRDLIDPPAQQEHERLMHLETFEEVALKIRSTLQAKAPPGRQPRNVLCLSGGGSFGAYSAGVL